MNQLLQLWESLSIRHRITIGLATFAVVGGLWWFARWNAERDFKPLFGSMGAEHAALVVSRLREGGIEFRLGENGTTILVPSGRVAEVRLQLASAGIPKSGRIGFELFLAAVLEPAENR